MLKICIELKEARDYLKQTNKTKPNQTNKKQTNQRNPKKTPNKQANKSQESCYFCGKFSGSSVSSIKIKQEIADSGLASSGTKT